MGTRADFYVGKGKDAEWLGSIAYGAYPGNELVLVTTCITEPAYRDAVRALLARREDATTPEMGWPWPWDNSQGTDYAYCFNGSRVEVFCLGRFCDSSITKTEAPKAEFPDMTKIKKVTMGQR